MYVVGTDGHRSTHSFKWNFFPNTSQINEVIRIISLRIRVRMKGTVGLE